MAARKYKRKAKEEIIRKGPIAFLRGVRHPEEGVWAREGKQTGETDRGCEVSQMDRARGARGLCRDRLGREGRFGC